MKLLSEKKLRELLTTAYERGAWDHQQMFYDRVPEEPKQTFFDKLVTEAEVPDNKTVKDN